MATRSVTRIQILSIVFLILGIFCIARVAHLQILNSEEFRKMGERQYIQPKSGFSERGNIYMYSKEGEKFLVAGNESGFRVVVNQMKVESPTDLFLQIGDLLSMTEESFLKKVEGDDPYKVLKEKVDKITADKIASLKIPSITLERLKWRIYPAENIASQSIGFVGFDNERVVGRYGIEKKFEEILSLKEKNVHINFFAEVFLNLKKYISEEKDNKEGDIILTLEPKVSRVFFESLSSLKKRWNSEMVGGIIMDPKTGEILAMESLPNFNPNIYSQVLDIGVFRNNNISGVFEFGSVVKPLIMASALDVKAVTPTTEFFDKGNVVVGNKTIKNFDGKGRGQVKMEDVLIQSLNTGMVFISQKMKKDDMRSYLKNFGLDKHTGIDLPNEEKGNLKNLDTKRDIEYATASFGQGISMTPIELITAFSAFANDGKSVRPFIVKKIEYKDPVKKDEITPVVFSEPIISPSASLATIKMLNLVVDKGINGGKHKMENYRIAAKTGTAQIPNLTTGGYYEDRYLHSLIGFFPAYDPKFLVFMYNYYPKGVNYAAVSLADPFFEMAKFLLNYYNVEPDRLTQ